MKASGEGITPNLHSKGQTLDMAGQQLETMDIQSGAASAKNSGEPMPTYREFPTRVKGTSSSSLVPLSPLPTRAPSSALAASVLLASDSRDLIALSHGVKVHHGLSSSGSGPLKLASAPHLLHCHGYS